MKRLALAIILIATLLAPTIAMADMNWLAPVEAEILVDTAQKGDIVRFTALLGQHLNGDGFMAFGTTLYSNEATIDVIVWNKNQPTEVIAEYVYEIIRSDLPFQLSWNHKKHLTIMIDDWGGRNAITVDDYSDVEVDSEKKFQNKLKINIPPTYGVVDALKAINDAIDEFDYNWAEVIWYEILATSFK
jgi:hypothetical protein